MKLLCLVEYDAKVELALRKMGFDKEMIVSPSRSSIHDIEVSLMGKGYELDISEYFEHDFYTIIKAKDGRIYCCSEVYTFQRVMQLFEG